jgi:hypothetical protein
MRTLSFVLLAMSPVWLGCQRAPTGSTTLAQVVIGTIDAGGTLPNVIKAPASGSVGKPLSLIVSTFGNSCVAAAGADVIVHDLQATVTPYDQEYRSGPCLHYLKPYPRPVTVTFDRAGDATIRVQGRSLYKPGLVAVEQQVTVARLQ